MKSFSNLFDSKFEWCEDDGAAGWDVNREAISPFMLFMTLVYMVPLFVASIKSLQSTKFIIIGLIKDHVWRVPIRTKQVVLVRVRRMEVEDEDEFAALVHDHLVVVVDE